MKRPVRSIEAGRKGRPARKRIGWREWVGLPELGIPEIKAKIDTGARTSTLHAYRITPFEKDGRAFVRFLVHPVQRRRLPEIECVAPLAGRRAIRDSGGKTEHRYIVLTRLRVGDDMSEIELTLTNRDQMSFRMLVGRAAIRGRFDVDPGRSFRTGRLAARAGQALNTGRSRSRGP
jgi:hypothetical protein